MELIGMKMIFAFDVDGVLLAPKSSWKVMHSHFGVDNSENVRKYFEGKITYDDFVRLDIELLLKKNPNVTKDDFETLKLKIEPNPNYQELSNFLRSVDGLKLAISGGIDVLVARIKDFYPIDQIYSNKLVFENNRLVGGKAEVEPQRKGIILSKFKGKKISVGDSRLDEDMFKASDYSILFNSEDEVKVDYVVKGNDLKELTRLLRDLYYG